MERRAASAGGAGWVAGESGRTEGRREESRREKRGDLKSEVADLRAAKQPRDQTQSAPPNPHIEV